MQFSLRQLLLTVTGICVMAGLIVWDPFWGTIVTLAVVSLGLVALGVWKRQKRLVFVGIGVLVVGVLFVVPSFFPSRISWSGTKRLEVYVRVIDTDTFEPVPNAKVEVLDGPPSPLEGKTFSHLKSEFIPATLEPGVGELVTDSQGWCTFPHRFFASGSEDRFGESGYVDTSGTWLRVSAQGRGAILIPLDRQSIRPRDINDETPLCVTVPLRRQYIGEAEGTEPNDLVDPNDDSFP